MQPDDNDIVFNQYGLDVQGLLEFLLNKVLGLGVTPESIWGTVQTLWDIFSILALLVSFVFIALIIYSYLKINEYLELESKQLDLMANAWKESHAPKGDNQRWAEVLRHVASDRPNDWKLAIIEADIMLGEGLKEKGYAGVSIGDQLKGIAPAQLQSLQDAWDAHRIRNRIAHEGSDFVLTQALAREAIVKYERALRELGVI